MNVIRKRIGPARSDESGLSLIEVIVAMMIFAIIATGALYSMAQVLTVTRDTRARQVAANLAAQEIDLDRATADVFTLLSTSPAVGALIPDKVVQLNGDTFRLHREARWVANPDASAQCGAGGGTLRYKQINVTVTWDNMRPGAQPVRADTLIDPKTRINDPDLGTILVSVINSSGTGSEGVDVTATPASPANGAASLTTVPFATDAEGCSYILKVKPGNYNVSISKAGYIDFKTQVATPTELVQVTRGTSTSVGFEYDKKSTLKMKYPAGSTVFPPTLDTSLLSTYYTSVSPATTNNPPERNIDVYPFASGYSVIAGKYVAPAAEGATAAIKAGCVSVDPDAWPDTTSNGTNLVGNRPAKVASAPGGRMETSVPMGVVRINGLGSNNRFLKAVSATSSYTGDPGCGIEMSYSFGRVLETTNSTLIALPYGSWRLYVGDSATSTSNVVTTLSMTPVTRGGVSALTSVLTLDPREVTP